MEEQPVIGAVRHEWSVAWVWCGVRLDERGKNG